MSLRMRDAIVKIADRAVKDAYPVARYGVVQAINHTNRQATVRFQGETVDFDLPYQTFGPLNTGSTVRVNGPAGARYIDQVLDGAVAATELVLTSTEDVTTSDGTGALQVGSSGSANIGIDGNEIQARSGGAGSYLGLNIGGGDVEIGTSGAAIRTRWDESAGTFTLGYGNNRRLEVYSNNDQMLRLIGDLAGSRPYVAFFNRDNLGNLDRKGYVGYPDADSGTSTFRVAADQGYLYLYSPDYIRVNPRVLVDDGQVTGPAYSFTNSSTSGMWLYATNSISLVTASNDRLIIDSTGNFDFNGGVLSNVNEVVADVGSVTDPSFTFDGETDTGMYLYAANGIGFTAGSTVAARMYGTYAYFGNAATGDPLLQHTSPTPSITRPAFSFANDNNTGMYRAAADSIEIACGGGRGLYIQQTAFYAPGVYDQTTTTAANVNLADANGLLRRVTSSIRYKKLVARIKSDEAHRIVGVVANASFRYKSRSHSDDPDTIHIGTIAEHLAKDEAAETFVTYRHRMDDKPRPESVQYERIVVPLAVASSDHESRISELESLVSSLVGAS